MLNAMDLYAVRVTLFTTTKEGLDYTPVLTFRSACPLDMRQVKRHTLKYIRKNLGRHISWDELKKLSFIERVHFPREEVQQAFFDALVVAAQKEMDEDEEALQRFSDESVASLPQVDDEGNS